MFSKTSMSATGCKHLPWTTLPILGFFLDVVVGFICLLVVCLLSLKKNVLLMFSKTPISATSPSITANPHYCLMLVLLFCLSVFSVIIKKTSLWLTRFDYIWDWKSCGYWCFWSLCYEPPTRIIRQVLVQGLGIRKSRFDKYLQSLATKSGNPNPQILQDWSHDRAIIETHVLSANPFPLQYQKIGCCPSRVALDCQTQMLPTAGTKCGQLGISLPRNSPFRMQLSLQI